MTRKIVFASEDIPYGARVVVRGCRAALATDRFSNAVVVSRPTWCDDGEVITAGRDFTVMMSPPEKLDLQAVANGPIMDSNELYLPAGKISLAEARQREAALILPDALSARASQTNGGEQG